MKTLNIDIVQADILSEVSKICSFVGGKEYQDGVSLYDAIRITDQEAPLLSEFILSAKRAILARFNRFSELTDTGIAMLLPDAYNESRNEDIAKEAISFIVNFTTSKWFEIVAKSRAQEYQQYATTNMVHLEKEIFARMAPEKRTNWQLTNIS